MINEILAKLPEATRERLEREAHCDYDLSNCFGYICGVLAATRDFGVINWDEYDTLRDHYFAVLRGNAR